MAHSIKALLSHFDAAFKRKFGERAPIIGGKDSALAKRLLAIYSLDRLKELVDQFFASVDPFIQQSGYSFGAFHSQIGKLIAEGKATEQVRVSPRIARSLKAIYGEPG